MTMPTDPTADRARLREIAESLCGLQAHTSFEKAVQELARGVLALTERVTSELPACAALLLQSGMIVAGRRHNDCLAALRSQGIDKTKVSMDGFITTRGHFVPRERALKMMLDAGIPSVRERYQQELYSEDLY